MAGRPSALLRTSSATTAGPGSGGVRPAPDRAARPRRGGPLRQREEGSERAIGKKGRPTAARARELAARESGDAERRPGPAAGAPSDRPPRGAGPGTPLAAPTRAPFALRARPRDRMAPCPGRPRRRRRAFPSGGRAPRRPGDRASAPARDAARGRSRARASGATTTAPPPPLAGPRPHDRAGLDGPSRREALSRRLREFVLLRALRPAVERDVLPSRFVRLAPPVARRGRARPKRPGSRPSPPRVRRTDRRETSAGPTGEGGGRRGRSFGGPLGRSDGASSGRGRARRRPRVCVRGSAALPPPPQFPSPTCGPGTVIRPPGRRFKASSCLARRGRGPGSSASTPRVPTPAAAGPPERRGPGPSRAPGPERGETQLCLCLAFLCSPVRGVASSARQGARPATLGEAPRQLLAVDHSARASMKNAASCEN